MVTSTGGGTTSWYPTSDRTFDIAKFRSTITKRGVARNNAYEIYLIPPTNVTKAMGNEQEIGKELTMFAETVTLPGMQFATTEIRNQTIGPIQYKPYLPIFPKDLMINFMVDENALIMDFFHTWMKKTINFSSEGKGMGLTVFDGASPFEVSYKIGNDGTAQYTTDLHISVLNNHGVNGTQIMQYILYNAYPVLIGDVQVSYGFMDNLLVLPIGFNFTDWSSRRFEPSIAGSSAGPSPIINNSFSGNVDNLSNQTGTPSGTTKGT